MRLWTPVDVTVITGGAMYRQSRPPRAETDAALADLVATGILLMDASGAAVMANPAWIELTGQRHGAWRGASWLSALPAELRPRRLDEILSECHAGSVYEDEWVIPGQPEAQVWHVVAKPDLDSDVLTRIVVSAVDVTAARANTADLTFQATHDALTGVYNRAQFALFVQHALDRRRRDGTSAAVLFLDVDELKTTNDAFGHDAGDRVLETIASRLCAAVRPGDVVARYGGDEFAILCEGLGDEDEAVVIADRIGAAMGEPYAGDGSCGVSIGVAVADGHLRVADLVREADRAMYDAKQGRPPPPRSDRPGSSTQLAIAAHELRTPVTAIVGSAVMLLERWKDDMPPAEVDAAVSMIVRQSTRLAGIVDDLLDLGRVSHQSGPIEPVDVAASVESALDVASAPESTSITIRGLAEPSRLQALGHEPSLVRAIVNLLTNAYRHGGPSVTVSLRRDGEQVEIDVEDDGPGVPPELVPTLFDLFTRGDLSKRGSEWRGTGLGLAVARHAAEAVGGHLRHTAVEPHGARFTLVLPSAAPNSTPGGAVAS
ncbi:MAG: diguanylate cyclase domain-containing protein [Acidimicrobiales bacterium]